MGQVDDQLTFIKFRDAEGVLEFGKKRRR